MSTRVYHTFAAFCPENSEILILGSFPSVKSREQEFYYAHPQNRFWKVLAACFGDAVPMDTESKKAFLSRHKIALWDVVESCEITGSSDSSIKRVLPTDIPHLLRTAPIKKIILNGRAAEKYYLKFHSKLPIPTIALPSTSPANASFSLEKLVEQWSRELL